MAAPGEAGATLWAGRTGAGARVGVRRGLWQAEPGLTLWRAWAVYNININTHEYM